MEHGKIYMIEILRILSNLLDVFEVSIKYHIWCKDGACFVLIGYRIKTTVKLKW